MNTIAEGTNIGGSRADPRNALELTSLPEANKTGDKFVKTSTHWNHRKANSSIDQAIMPVRARKSLVSDFRGLQAKKNSNNDSSELLGKHSTMAGTVTHGTTTSGFKNINDYL